MRASEQQQVEREEMSRALGIDRYRAEVLTKGHADTPAGKRIITTVLDPLAKSIGAWLRERQTGKWAAVASLIRHVDPYELALLALKTTLRSYEMRFVLGTASEQLGRLIEEHIEWTALRRHKNYGMQVYARKVEDHMRQTSSLHRQRRRIRGTIERFRESEGWTKQQCVAVGLNIIERMVMLGLFTKQYEGRLTRRRVLLEASDTLREFIEGQHDRLEILSPVHVPLVVPPRPWTGLFDGGYYVTQLPFVKRLKHQAVDTYNPDDMKDVYDAVNVLQAVPWQINQPILKLMSEVWEDGGNLGSLPARDNAPLPRKPDDIATNEPARKEWRQRASRVHSANARAGSKRAAMSSKLSIAEALKDNDKFYFTYQCDYRGRLYAVGTHLSPQGDDSARALMRLAEGKPLGEEGVHWLAIHIANTYGHDKVSLEDRVQWVYSHTAQILDSALNPLDGGRWWIYADKPWCCLAACLEWVRYTIEGPDAVSHLPVAVDGSCNGLQHFAAALRDPVGAQSVNLVPSDKPADVYQTVADRASSELDRILESTPADDSRHEHAAWWRASGLLDRALVKRNVMTVPYGATQFGMRNQLLEECRKRGITEDMQSRCNFLGSVVYECIGTVVRAAREAMDWLQATATVASEAGVPLEWTSPSGFPVSQDHRSTRGRRVGVRIGGQLHQITLQLETSGLNKRKQVAGVAPNVVHSWDAAHLVDTVLDAAANGLTAFSMVHDSYATLACDVPALNTILRRAFIRQYEVNPLQQFRDEIISQLPEEHAKLVPPLPKVGSLDLSQVMEADFFFA